VAKSSVVMHAKACRFVVVEDDALLCDLLASKLRQQFEPASLHAFRNGREALQHCLKETVDLLFTDLGLPDVDGRELIRQSRQREHKPRVIVLTAKIDASLPGELVSLGVAGFVDKAVPLEHAVRAVQRVLAGGMYFCADVAPTQSGAAPTAPGPSASILSAREREIALLVARGLSSKEIASRLGLSTRTVENHRARLMQKIGVHDTVKLVRWCVERGLG
jgi:DNA-binding NarL/FixJ family response regulator